MLNHYNNIKATVLKIIRKKTGIKDPDLINTNSEFNKLGLDNVDIVDMILEVEKKYHVIIPDEVPLNTPNDFVNYINVSYPKLAG